MTSPPSAGGEATGRKQAQVIAAARALFLAHGFEGTTMNMIAAQADVSKATLYAYYPAKEQVFMAVMRGEMRRLREDLEAVLRDPRKSTRDKLLAVGWHKARGYASRERVVFFRTVIAATLRFPELGRLIEADIYLPLRDTVARIVEDGVRARELSCPDPRAASGMLLAMMRGDLVTSLMFDPDAAQARHADMAAHVDACVDFFMRACRPDAP